MYNADSAERTVTVNTYTKEETSRSGSKRHNTGLSPITKLALMLHGGTVLRTFFGRFFRSEVHYVNGAAKLPAPLTGTEEQRCLAALMPGEPCEAAAEARQLLIEHNLRLVVYIAKKFENTGTGLEDLISIGTIGLIKAINTFHPEKNIKLATYASRCIENEILMYIRKTQGLRNEISLDEPLNVDRDGNELLLSDVLGTDADTVYRGIEEEEERDFIRRAVEKLCDRDRAIIKMRFGIGTNAGEKTQKEVAEALGISQSYISRLEKKIIEELKGEIEKFYQM